MQTTLNTKLNIIKRYLFLTNTLLTRKINENTTLKISISS